MVRQFNQVLPVFKGLAKLLHTRFGTIYTIDTLRLKAYVRQISARTSDKSKITVVVGYKGAHCINSNVCGLP